MKQTAGTLDITFTATLGRVRKGDTWTCVQPPDSATVFGTRGQGHSPPDAAEKALPTLSNHLHSVRHRGEVGFYLVESDNEADVRAICGRFAARGELIEFRRLAE